MPKVDHLLWVDLETDGNDDPEQGNLLEIAFILTDPEGRVEHTAVEWVLQVDHWPSFDAMPEVVYRMHAESGLLDDVVNSENRVRLVETHVLEVLSDFGVARGRVALAGSGVSHYDSRWLAAKMPTLASMLPYWQSVDVGHIRRFLSMSGYGYVIDPSLEGAKTHRAMDDIRTHLAEWRYFQDRFGAAFKALIDFTASQGVVREQLIPTHESEPDEGPEVKAPEVPVLNVRTMEP